MDQLLLKRFFVFKVVILAFSIFAVYPIRGIANTEGLNLLSLESTPSTMTDDEINGFLFRINENVRKKILMLASEPIEHLPIPILFGVSVGDFTDTWGEARAGGKVHTGTDMSASLGELVVSPTDAVVTKIGYDNRGGNFIVTANPGGEQFYFAHLDRVAENLSVGDALKSGNLIGYLGNTGNARDKSPHLHFEIYYKGLARNPFPRLVREFSREERVVALEHILTESRIVFGAHNGGVRFLQRFLIHNNTGPHAKALAKIGATGYFGTLTKNALAEYQHATNISLASGYFGSMTRSSIQTFGGN